MKAYLDIETSYENKITVIGMYRPETGVVQLVDRAITPSNLLATLCGVRIIYTYNGERFDLPVIQRSLGLDLRRYFVSYDLLYDCWRRGLKGGLKKVELALGITRATQGLNGLDAMRLWERYRRWADEEALATLLLYNREDVLNLAILERRLVGNYSPLPPLVDVQIIRY